MAISINQHFHLNGATIKQFPKLPFCSNQENKSFLTPAKEIQKVDVKPKDNPSKIVLWIILAFAITAFMSGFAFSIVGTALANPILCQIGTIQISGSVSIIAIKSAAETLIVKKD